MKKKLPIRNIYRHINYRISSSILSAVKRVFTQSGIVQDKYKEQRIELPKYNKDGSRSKRDSVRYKCSSCGELFSQGDSQCDHIVPVVPVNIPTEHMSWDILIDDRLFVDLDGLQILCKPCHVIKSNEENALRREWKKKEKFIIYRTTNTVNHKQYIGRHKCLDLNDNYLGSGVILKAAIQKYGKDSFIRHVLYVYDNEEDSINKETELITEEVLSSEKYYNLAPGGQFFSNRKTPSNAIKITAVNMKSGDRKDYISVADCCRDLDLKPSRVLGICAGSEVGNTCKGWGFITEKYGQSFPDKKEKPDYKILNDKVRGFRAFYKNKYLTCRKDKKLIEEVITYHKEYGVIKNNKHIGNNMHISKSGKWFKFMYGGAFIKQFTSIKNAIIYRDDYLSAEEMAERKKHGSLKRGKK